MKKYIIELPADCAMTHDELRTLERRFAEWLFDANDVVTAIPAHVTVIETDDAARSAFGPGNLDPSCVRDED